MRTLHSDLYDVVYMKLGTLANSLKNRLDVIARKGRSLEGKSMGTTLVLLYRRRMHSAWGRIQLRAQKDLRNRRPRELVTLTRCRKCGRRGLTLLTSSSREHPSPRLMDKLRALLSPSSPPPKSPPLLSQGFARLTRLLRSHLTSAFEQIYLHPPPKSASLLDFRPSEVISPSNDDKVYNISFNSAIIRDNDPSAAVILMANRIEKVFLRRLIPVYDRLVTL